MDWIDKKFEARQNAEKKRQTEEYLIDYSNYWANLKEQIRQDVEKIGKLWNVKISISNTEDGYKISKAESFPTVIITISNGGDNVNVRTQTAQDLEDDDTTDESFIVISQNRRIYLKNDSTVLLVPEQASEYILSPIVEALNVNQ